MAGEFLDPSNWPMHPQPTVRFVRPPNPWIMPRSISNDLSESFWGAVAPNTLSLMRGEDRIVDIPDGYIGKIPPIEDPRPMNSLVEGLSFLGRPGTGAISSISNRIGAALMKRPLAS